MEGSTATLTLCQRYQSVRARSTALAAPLSPEDACVQSMPDASPTKWHLAHTTWFFETFVLAAHAPGYAPHDPSYRWLFNSYYNGVGAQHARSERGLITRPDLAAVRAYRAAIDGRMLELLRDPPAASLALIELGLQHEQQHQELMLTDLKHLLSCNPLAPAYQVTGSGGGAADGAPGETVEPLVWHDLPGGLVTIGHAGAGFAFDNETPRHQVWLTPFRLASRLVSNGEYLEFVDAGGYRDPLPWLSEGWQWRTAQQREHPAYWRRDDRGGWREFTLAGLTGLAPGRPALHLSYYEADAYARWRGARLPTEFEWEHAVTRGMPLRQLHDVAWQWTSSSYAPYPGYRPVAGAVGEYNGKFMVNQYVLRGGSLATPAGHARATYRNFFPAGATWQFTGLRLASD